MKSLIPAGYMAKRVIKRPEWLQPSVVEEVWSVSNCISEDFCDYIDHWKHNGWWLFDCPKVIETLARTQKIHLSESQLFYYEVFEKQFVEETGAWEYFSPESDFATKVEAPENRELAGFDVVTFTLGCMPECSPLSCNGLAKELPVNRHCLLDKLQLAQDLLDAGKFRDSEPGPFRIFAVYPQAW